MKKINLIDQIDFSLTFCHEMVENNGEDACFSQVSDKYAAACVFDGCGGLGSKNYAAFGGKTGAYMASRLVSGATQGWFSTLSPEHLRIEDYRRFIDYAYETVNRYADTGGPVIKGSMKKAFATTIVSSILSVSNNTVYADFFWAGDSRGYVLDEKGLHQVTVDDIEGEDALSNLSGDGVLSNVAFYGGSYDVHSKKIALPEKCLVFSATDGCFGYLTTPMEFEHLLLDTLLHSDSAISWEKKIEEKLGKIAGDDYTLSLLAVGFGDFSSLKRYFYQRAGELQNEYVKKLEDVSEEEKVALWNKYKTDYYSISPEADLLSAK